MSASELISSKELYAGDWLGRPISPKTFRRERERWQLVPVDRHGSLLYFRWGDVLAARSRRQRAIEQQFAAA